MSVSLAGVAPSAARALLKMPVSLSPVGLVAPAPAMEWASTASVPLVSMVCVLPFPPQNSPPPPSFLLPVSLSSFCMFRFVFFSSFPLGAWDLGIKVGTLGADERKTLLRLPYSACPPQVISVSCCPPAPQTLASMEATVSLLLASWLSAPAPLAGKVHKLLLSPPTLPHLLSSLRHTGPCWGPRGELTLGSAF